MIWLSLGENCIPDDILKRFGLKTFATPFSHGRTNIEYATQADQEDFASLLLPESLVKEDFYGKPVVRNHAYTCEKGLYDSSVASGFEFTHHDVINDPAARDSYTRKIERWNETRRTAKEVCFLYHHRDWGRKNIDGLTAKLVEFQYSYARDGAHCHIVLLDQNVSKVKPRSFAVSALLPSILHVSLVTEQHWSGNDVAVFWGRVDDDLLRPALKRSADMLKHPKRLMAAG